MKSVETLAREFVNGYMAGSCNSYETCINRFAEELIEHEIYLDGEVEPVLNEAIESAGIFNCDCCGWWCWDHEHSEIELGNCDECSPREEEDE